MKSTAQLVMEYIDNVPVGDFVVRQELIKYVNENCVDKSKYGNEYYVRCKYSTVDNYRKILELNNVILPALYNFPGHYMKINEVPMNVSMHVLRDRAYTNPYYPTNKRGLLSWAKDLYN